MRLGTDIGSRIKDLREHLGLTQAKFAVALYRSKSTVAGWEQGEDVPETVIRGLMAAYDLPESVFAPDGPMPSTVVNAAVNSPTGGGRGAVAPSIKSRLPDVEAFTQLARRVRDLERDVQEIRAALEGAALPATTGMEQAEATAQASREAGRKLSESRAAEELLKRGRQ